MRYFAIHTAFHFPESTVTANVEGIIASRGDAD
jgi:hypothetical protein